MSHASSFRRVACAAAGMLAALSVPAAATPFAVTYTDPAGYGFNDASAYTRPPFSPATPGTLGQARRYALEAVMENWGARLSGNIPITVDAAFEAMGGTDNSAALAFAGPTYTIGFTSTEIPFFWAVAANAAQIGGRDFIPGQDMIVARFNSDVDGPTVLGNVGFYYGVDGMAGGDLDFYHTTLHEFGHGLGLLDLLEQEQDGSGGFQPTGEYELMSGVREPGVYDLFMADGTSGVAVLLTDMTPAERKAALTGNALYFNGPLAAAANGGLLPRLYAPRTWVAGSSASHLDEATYRGFTFAANVNELMTPNIGPGVAHSPGPAVTGMLKDMAWLFQPYTLADAAQALRIAGGLDTPTTATGSYLNVVGYTTWPGRIDMLDAIKIARMAAGAEPNPNP